MCLNTCIYRVLHLNKKQVILDTTLVTMSASVNAAFTHLYTDDGTYRQVQIASTNHTICRSQKNDPDHLRHLAMKTIPAMLNDK